MQRHRRMQTLYLNLCNIVETMWNVENFIRKLSLAVLYSLYFISLTSTIILIYSTISQLTACSKNRINVCTLKIGGTGDT